jgi:hypothetical protein
MRPLIPKKLDIRKRKERKGFDERTVGSHTCYMNVPFRVHNKAHTLHYTEFFCLHSCPSIISEGVSNAFAYGMLFVLHLVEC